MKGVGKSGTDRQPRAPLPNKNMRLTKKAAALLVAASMVATMGMTSFAATNKIESKYVDGELKSFLNDKSDAEETANKATTEVKYEVSENYIWSIPSEIDFGSNVGASEKTSTVGYDVETNEDTHVKKDSTSIVKVEKNVIPATKSLKITMAGENSETDTGFRVKDVVNGNFLSYTVTKAKESMVETSDTKTDSITSGGNVLTVASGTDTASAELTFVLTTEDAKAEKAGSYRDTITFTASVN